MYSYIFSPKILAVKTNMKDIDAFIFGRPPTFKFNKDSAPCAVNLEYLISDRLDIKTHYEAEIKKSESLTIIATYLRKIPGGLTAKLNLLRSVNGNYRLVANRFYSFWSYLRFTKQYPAPRILSNIACVALIEKGYVPLHCSAVSFNNVAVVIAAFPDTGKTLTASQLVNGGCQFLGEDIAITDGNIIYACPFTSTGNPLKENLLAEAKRQSGKIFFKTNRKQRLIDSIKETQLISSAPIRYFFFLEHGPRKITPLKKQDGFKLLLRLNRSEFRYLGDNLLISAWTRHGKPDLQLISESEAKILLNMINTTEKVFCISCPNSLDFAEEITTILKSS